jgi:hypothetical protein
VGLKNAKQKGSRNEFKTMRGLEMWGYVCMKAGGSLGVWDVIGIGEDTIVLVQCKSNAWPGSVEMSALRSFRAPINAIKFVHRWRDRQPLPDIRIIP